MTPYSWLLHTTSDLLLNHFIEFNGYFCMGVSADDHKRSYLLLQKIMLRDNHVAPN